jgi:class 3 adenylate cyclase/fermentation-respiration switch protein FrsA (DUF1100 family)
MGREIRYCTTEDGVNIAYCVEGAGPTTILALPVFYETFSLDHLMPVYPQFYRELGAGRRIVRFDWRGTGLSAQVPGDAQEIGSIDSWLLDLSSVTRAAGAPCVVWASTIAAIPAINFAVAHPELVTHVILYGTYAAVADAFKDDLLDGFRNLVRVDWKMAAQTISDTNGRREHPDEAGQLGDWFYQSITQEAYLVVTDPETGRTADVTDKLSEVRAPTLILHRIADPIIPFSAGQKLAAGIPGARFVPLEGKGHLFCLGDYSRILSSVDDFLGDRAKAAPASTPEVSSFRTILFTDLVGHTEMMSRLGDERGRDVLREHERITRETLKANGGTEVKTMGDGFMASFGSVTKAVECAVALQRAFADHEGESLNVRVGLNAGEPIEEDGDLFGATVILASRIAAKAGGGEILVADTVRGLCSGKGFLFADRGEFVAKGFEEPVRISEVSWRG